MEINEQWDLIASERFEHRMTGKDLSYNEVFLPTIKNYFSRQSTKEVLDFGCGTGELSFEISKMGFNVTGIDISKHSIEIAKKNFISENLNFINQALSEITFHSKFSIAVANMSLMDTQDLISNILQINDKLETGGSFIAIITHPTFWPIYWNYTVDENFNYLEECKITKIYKTKTKTFDFKTTHYHRPISYYIDKFIECNFRICKLQELKNPNDSEWFPRFLFFELEKTLPS